MKNKKPVNELNICELGGKLKCYIHQDHPYPTPCCLTQDTSRTLEGYITHSDNKPVVIANEWTSFIKRERFTKEQLRIWCEYIDRAFEYIPQLDELLYSYQDP